MGVREYALLTQETTYGTFPVSPEGGTQAAIFLEKGNSFTPRKIPNFWELRSAGSSNRKVLRGTEQYGVKGKIMTRLFPSQAKLLMPLCLTLSGSPLNLPSFSVEHAIMLDDGSSTVKARYTGFKVESWSLKADNSAGGIVFSLEMDVIGQAKASSSFVEPNYAGTGGSIAYPNTDPFAFQDTAGIITCYGGVLANYSSFEINGKNKLRTPFDEGLTIAANTWSGRDIQLQVKKRYLSTTARSDYEANTAETVAVSFYDGTNTGTLQLNTANFASVVADDLPFEGDGYYQMLTFENFMDTTAGQDLSYTQTP